MAQLFGSINPLTPQLVALDLPKSDSKKPDKSTAVSPKPEPKNKPTTTGEELDKINDRRKKKDVFIVNYYVGEQEGKELRSNFIFALLPAIDHIVNYSASGPFRGNESVPEVKPGIPIRTAMKHRNTVIPGGTNVVQTIGIDSKYIVLVGAFVGTEQDTTGAPPGSTFYDTIYQRIGNPKDALPEYNSYTQAMLFNKQVVEKGAPVNITIQTEGQKPEESIKVTGVIVDFKLQAVRESKTYYAMTVLYTNQTKPKTSNSTESNTTSTPKRNSTTTSTPKPGSKIPPANNKKASATPAEDLKNLPDLEVIKREGLIGRRWTAELATRIRQVYGFSQVSLNESRGNNAWVLQFTRKESSPLAKDFLTINLKYIEKDGVIDWHIKHAY